MSPLLGLYAGIIATLGMSLVEYPIWRRWGLAGVAEWRLNQAIVARFSRKPEEEMVVEGVLLHFAHGAIAGLIFGWALMLLPLMVSPILLGLLFGMLLWVISVAITKPITGTGVFGKPSTSILLVSGIVGHLVYGLLLGTLLGIL
jgi:uncharacterized membrane protein YagU involved in acid resistance